MSPCSWDSSVSIQPLHVFLIGFSLGVICCGIWDAILAMFREQGHLWILLLFERQGTCAKPCLHLRCSPGDNPGAQQALSVVTSRDLTATRRPCGVAIQTHSMQGLCPDSLTLPGKWGTECTEDKCLTGSSQRWENNTFSEVFRASSSPFPLI